MALTFANKVTIGRILIVPFFIAMVMYTTPGHDYFRFCAIGLFMVAVISDVIDG
ncbi:MAG: CDP-alcohol phosphatidyltransferase family protein [Candidatus Omnitrophica bacterium]|nr:CDP-alcohol phosphatidyltransferase family protein [Candidatus Omnitrophota bacterium]